MKMPKAISTSYLTSLFISIAALYKMGATLLKILNARIAGTTHGNRHCCQLNCFSDITSEKIKLCTHKNRTAALIYIGVFFPSPPKAFSALLPWLLHAVQHIKPLLLFLTSPLVRLTVYKQNNKG